MTTKTYEDEEFERLATQIEMSKAFNIPVAAADTKPYKFPSFTEEDMTVKGAAIKHDSGKLDWSLIPWDSVEEILKVLEFGKHKYAAWNWSSNGGFKYTRIFNSLIRHLFAWVRGEDKDPESGLSHLAHAGCNILFLLYFVRHKDKYTTNDDRNV